MKRIYGIAILAALFALASAAQDADAKSNWTHMPRTCKNSWMRP